MEELVKKFPLLILEGLEIAEKSFISKADRNIQNIVISGMGGSGFGGRLICDWLYELIEIPVIIVQRYEIPSFVNEQTLFISCSYSGNTEETISATERAIMKKAVVVGISSGGLLSQICDNKKLDRISLPSGLPPRAALPISIVQIIHILKEFDIVEKRILDELKLVSTLLYKKYESIRKSAKNIAESLRDKHIMIYTDAKLESVAIRARQQINENSKMLCTHNVIPEMNHNELVGWTGGSQENAALFLIHDQVSIQNVKRLNYVESIIKKKTNNIFKFLSKNNNLILNSLEMIYFVDILSVEIAKIKNLDPLDISVIENLKVILKKD